MHDTCAKPSSSVTVGVLRPVQRGEAGVFSEGPGINSNTDTEKDISHPQFSDWSILQPHT